MRLSFRRTNFNNFSASCQKNFASNENHEEILFLGDFFQNIILFKVISNKQGGNRPLLVKQNRMLFK